MAPTTSFPSTSDGQVLAAVADPALRQLLETACSELCPKRAFAVSVPGLIEALESSKPDIVLIDSALLGDAALDVLARVHRAGPESTIMLLAPREGSDAAFRLLNHGVSDVIGLPPHPLELKLRIGRLLETRDLGTHLATLEEAISERSRQSFNTRTVVARSASMRALGETIDRVAKMRTTVLVLGESGVGKELVSRNIHFRSPRSEGPFIPINCAALPPHLIETELFGHERGAFTGAVSRRAGKFELAHGGTLFLDEIGEIDLPTQAKLLRVIEAQEFMRVGGTRAVRVDVRLVAATNADLERLVREGRFRDDLFYRLKVVTLDIPPLRERREDIPELAETTLKDVCRANHLRVRKLTPAALEALCAYPWPGNVRELMNTLEAVVVATPSETIDVEHLPMTLQSGKRRAPAPRRIELAGRTLKDLEAEAIRTTLAAVDGSRTLAAEQLGIGVRTLRRRIQELGLEKDLPPKPGRPKKG